MTEDRCWDTIVSAENSTEAEHIAVTHPEASGDFEINVTDVTEIDENGNEVV
jgi:hypothetical protein